MSHGFIMTPTDLNIEKTFMTNSHTDAKKLSCAKEYRTFPFFIYAEISTALSAVYNRVTILISHFMITLT